MTMVRFTQLSISFKRYAGHHDLPLDAGEAGLTVIAAQNGVGKTTTLDAFFLAMYGKRGFRARYQGVAFEAWLNQAYAIDAVDEDRAISFALDMVCPVHGDVRIERTYWLLDAEDGGLSEEFGLTINGRPLEVEEGERRSDVASRWVEALLPLPAMRRFLVDNERLAELEPRRMDEDVRSGLDDVLGLGAAQRLAKHLNALRKQVEKLVIPEDEHLLLDELTNLQDAHTEELEAKEVEHAAALHNIRTMEEHAEVLNQAIRGHARAQGEEENTLRITWAKQHSELASARMKVKRYTEAELPFAIAGLPSSLQAWGFDEALAAQRSQSMSDQHLRFLDRLLEVVDAGEAEQALRDEGAALAQGGISESVSGPLAHISESVLERIKARFEERRQELDDSIGRTDLTTALTRLGDLRTTEERLRASKAGVDVVSAANELQALATNLGAMQANAARLEEECAALRSGLEQIQTQLDLLRSRSDADAPLNRKLALIERIDAVLGDARKRARAALAEPLAEEFKSGFAKLSRKSGRIASVDVDPTDYGVRLEMNGFEGNWLDRDLSATERQHTGLSLVYALRRMSTRALPIVVDTPVSRMDREHKEWSVHRFYPALSHQTIILTTSDDLADGLFDELLAQGSVGRGLHIQEISENSIRVEEADLRTFFGGVA